MTRDSKNHSKDDEVLAQLFQAGSKDTPPARLDHEILNYAANANRSARVGSHFGGGWKVPLSMAACLVLVFGILVQLEQSNQLLDLPAIPELTIPAESHDQNADHSIAAPENIEASRDENANKLHMNESHVDDATLGSQKDLPANKEKTLIKVQPEFSHERKQLEERTLSPSNAKKITPAAQSQAKQLKLKSSPDNLVDEPESIQKQAIEPEYSAPVLNEDAQESDQNKYIDEQNTSAGTSDREIKLEQEFAPFPVEDWLLMIEKLIARKDYAEAARQLQKFKQAHPKVNVDELEAKIP